MITNDYFNEYPVSNLKVAFIFREIWLNIYLTEMINNNRKLTAQLILHLLDYF